MKKLFLVLIILFGVSSFSFSSETILSEKATVEVYSPNWVYVKGQYYWDGDDNHVWDYDQGVLWEWDRDTNTWTIIRYQ